MILTDREIRISIDNSSIEIIPPPSDDAYASTSVDLTLETRIGVFNDEVAGLDVTVDPAKLGYRFDQTIGRITRNEAIGTDGFVLQRRQLLLGWTRERVNLHARSRIAARVEGKSSLARLGLSIHVTAPTIHAGFNGQIQLEILNQGPLPIRLRAGMRICQLIFEQTLGVPSQGYQGQFAGQAAARDVDGQA